MTNVEWIIGGLAALYLLIGFIHATTISSDESLTGGQLLMLTLCWPWKGRSWI